MLCTPAFKVQSWRYEPGPLGQNVPEQGHGVHPESVVVFFYHQSVNTIRFWGISDFGVRLSEGQGGDVLVVPGVIASVWWTLTSQSCFFPSACIPFLAWRCGDAFMWPHFSIEWETWGSTSLPTMPHGDQTGSPSQRCSTAPTGWETNLTYTDGCQISVPTQVPNMPRPCEFYLLVLGDGGSLPRVGVPWLPYPFLLVATCRFLSSKCRLPDTCTVC